MERLKHLSWYLPYSPSPTLSLPYSLPPTLFPLLSLSPTLCPLLSFPPLLSLPSLHTLPYCHPPLLSHTFCSGLNKMFPKFTICVSAFSLKISSPLLLQTQCCGRTLLSLLTMVCLEPGLPSGLYFHPLSLHIRCVGQAPREFPGVDAHWSPA